MTPISSSVLPPSGENRKRYRQQGSHCQPAPLWVNFDSNTYCFSLLWFLLHRIINDISAIPFVVSFLRTFTFIVNEFHSSFEGIEARQVEWPTPSQILDSSLCMSGHS